MSRRTEKLASSIRYAVADIVRNQLSDPRITSLTSITRVRVAPDLSSAHIHFSIIGSEGQQRACMQGLQHARKRVQSLLGRRLHIRQTPELFFHEDLSIKRGAETLRLIDEAMAELADHPLEGLGPSAPAKTTPAGTADKTGSPQR